MKESIAKNSTVLGRRITILCLSLVFSVSAVFIINFFINMASTNENYLRTRADLTMRYLNLDIQTHLEPAINLVENVAALLPSLDDLDHYLPIILPGLLKGARGGVTELYFGTAHSRFDGGSFTVATGLDVYGLWPQFDQVTRPWHINAMQNPGRIMFTDPYIDTATEMLCVTISTTASRDGRVIGVVGVDILIEALKDIVTTRTVTADGETFIINRDGLILVHRNSDYILTKNFFEIYGTGNINLSRDVEISISDGNYWVSMPKHSVDWFLVTTGSTAELTQAFYASLFSTLIMALVLTIAAIAAALYFSNSITRRVVKLFGILSKIAEGDFTQEIKATGKDEIAQMTMLLAETQEAIKYLIKNIKMEANLLSSIGSELAENMNKTAASMNEITENVQAVKERVQNQSASVTQSHATMKELVTNIEKLNKQVERQSTDISQTSSSIQQMAANIQSVNKTLSKNAENVQTLSVASEISHTGLTEVSQDIQEIARESEGLLEINAVMQNISSQTNLLSMNAAIEAAHAGETGKGFAVVAEEIRKLAENSGNQSKTTSAVLKKIKSSIDKITRSAQNVLNNFEAIELNVKNVAQQEKVIQDAMEQQNIGSREILNNTDGLREITSHVKDGYNEMYRGAQEVIRESINLEEATREITTSVNEMASGTEHINLAINRTNDMCRKNRESIEILVKEVARFKIE